MTGREKCNKLKGIRAALATKLGIDLHQVECTFEGECTGTCPKCKQEEDVLNRAILHKGAAMAGAVLLATSMSACATSGDVDYAGGTEPVDTINVSTDGGDDTVVLSGEVDERSLYGDDADTKSDDVDKSDTDKSDIKSDDVDKNDVDKTVDIGTDDLTGYIA